jgi:hypothetical protein
MPDTLTQQLEQINQPSLLDNLYEGQKREIKVKIGRLKNIWIDAKNAKRGREVRLAACKWVVKGTVELIQSKFGVDNPLTEEQIKQIFTEYGVEIECVNTFFTPKETPTIEEDLQNNLAIVR